MTTYYINLPTEYSSSTPPSTTLNITSADTIVVTVDTFTFSGGGEWLRFNQLGCTSTPISGFDGESITITPNVGATSYSLTVRSYNDDFAIFQYGRITGTISAPASDTTPDAFTFTDQTGVALSSTITSNTITVAGIDAATSISITGGTYNINGGAYTSSSGTVTNGQTVSVQHTSSAINSTATNTTLNIGGVTDTFTSTTAAVATDTTPDAFTFTDQTNVALNSVITSNTITVSGINAPASISITGGTYSIAGGAYTSASGTVTNAQTVSVRHTSSASNSTATNTTLTIGGVSDVFTSTTVAADTTPDAFTFTDQTGVSVNSTITSNTITVSGINAATSISITGGTYSIAGGVYTSATGSVTNGQTVTVRHTSSVSNSTATNTTLTIGGVSDVFTSTTVAAAADTVPNAFIFADQNDVAVSSTIVSSEIEILGINTGAPISITGGEYSIGLDPTTYTPYTSASGTIYNTQTVKVRHTSSANNSTATNTTLTIGGVSDVFTSTTIGAVGSGNYGLIVYDTLGNIMLDTTDITIKDLGMFSVASVTTNGTITGVPLTSNSIALVTNNNGDGDTAIAAPAVTLAPASSSIVVSGGLSGFNVSIRVMEF